MLEGEDLRLVMFSRDDVMQRVQRGVVCVLRSNASATGVAEEKSTNEWKTVGAVLHSLKMAERTVAKPQIRVVQKDAILQSNIGPWPSPGGLTTRFVEQELKAGDIVILTKRN